MSRNERSLLLGFAIGGFLSPIILFSVSELWGVRAAEIVYLGAIVLLILAALLFIIDYLATR